MQSTLAVVDDPLFEAHRAPAPHPERPERLVAARQAVGAAAIGAERRPLPGRDATDDELARVHRPRYVAALGQVAGGEGYLDPDTYYAPRSVAAARRAAGGALALTDALLDRTATFGVALLRPPGHHARPDAAMGFCLLNNVAIAAAHARASGARRVMVLDWDVHHGNGTQEMFYDDPSVLYVSLHQFPFYPGTGATSEVGAGEGRGYTVNVPLSAGADDAVYAAAFDRVIVPVAAEYDPDLVLISAGFDAHHRDPLASMELTAGGYSLLLDKLLAALPRPPAGRLGMLLEGGYDLTGLAESLRAVLQTLVPPASGKPPAPLLGPLSARHEAEISRARTALEPFWRLG